MDTVLVTGCEGQVGRAFCENQCAFNLVSYNRLKLDICNETLIGKSLDRVKPRLIVNTAAYTAVDVAEDDLANAINVNCLGPNRLSKACADRGIPLIHLSTDYVFDGSSNLPYPESVTPRPLCAYGVTKFKGEEYIRSNLSEHIILRLSGIFSSHGSCFPRSIIKAAYRHREVKVINDQIMGPTSAKSVANVIEMIASKITSGKAEWGTYHFAQQPFVSWYEFAVTILERAQKLDARLKLAGVVPVSTISYGAKAPRPKNSRLDSRKLLSKFDLDAKILHRNDECDAVIQAIISDLCRAHSPASPNSDNYIC